MKLSDVVSSLGFSTYPIVAMSLFLFVFVGVVYQVMRSSKKSEFERAAMLPLDDGAARRDSTERAS
ncbi:MAG: cbb3-type cytochrome c oxidase subunit 3 [Planctomycetes bacterium]|nr:cbb3-type cytochrome c oxidase subunit 3 [Planctomycetota bacterium]